MSARKRNIWRNFASAEFDTIYIPLPASVKLDSEKSLGLLDDGIEQWTAKMAEMGRLSICHTL